MFGWLAATDDRKDDPAHHADMGDSRVSGAGSRDRRHIGENDRVRPTAMSRTARSLRRSPTSRRRCAESFCAVRPFT